VVKLGWGGGYMLINTECGEKKSKEA